VFFVICDNNRTVKLCVILIGLKTNLTVLIVIQCGFTNEFNQLIYVKVKLITLALELDFIVKLVISNIVDY